MNLKSQTELANTKAKLARLKSRYENLRKEVGGDEELREASLQSLKRYINQFREEIARFEVDRAVK